MFFASVEVPGALRLHLATSDLGTGPRVTVENNAMGTYIMWRSRIQHWKL